MLGLCPFMPPSVGSPSDGDGWPMVTAAYSPCGRTETIKNLKLQQASDYLHRFHCDFAMHDPKLTRMRIDLVGADRVVRESDFRQGMAIKKPVEYVEAIPNITEKERQLVLCENTARLHYLLLSSL
jgi:hypothetical protein